MEKSSALFCCGRHFDNPPNVAPHPLTATRCSLGIPRGLNSSFEMNKNKNKNEVSFGLLIIAVSISSFSCLSCNSTPVPIRMWNLRLGGVEQSAIVAVLFRRQKVKMKLYWAEHTVQFVPYFGVYM